MSRHTLLGAAAAAVLALGPAATTAQTAAPMPAASPAAPAAPQPMQAPPMETATPQPATSAQPAGTNAPVHTMAPRPATSATPAGGAKQTAQVKQIPKGSLSLTDLRYALTHPLQEANQVRKMKSISFDKLRVYRLSSGMKSILKVGDANADLPLLAVLGPGVEIAQTTLPTNGSNSPIAVLQYVLANINVSNALNNVSVLNNSTVNVGVSLQDVLNGNKISIGQVAGIFVNGLGIITTITK